MHVTAPSLAERYLAKGYDLERLPLPAPFDFLAVGEDRVAAFVARDKVTAPVMVDVRLMARDLGAKPVFTAPAFTEEARRIAARFGIEIVDVPPRDAGDGAPVPPPPEAEEATTLHGHTDVPAPFPELDVDPVLVAEARAHPDFADFPEDPTPEELRDELRHVNAVLDHAPVHADETVDAQPVPDPGTAPAVAEEPAPLTASFAFLPAEVPTVLPDVAAPPAHPAEDPETDLARWYDELCALEARTLADEELADWYDALVMMEADALVREAEERLGLLALDAVLGTVPALPETAFLRPEPPAALVWPTLADLTPLARAAHVLAPEPSFAAGGAGAFRALEDMVPALPEVAFAVVTEDAEGTETTETTEVAEVPEDDAAPAEDFLASPFLSPDAMLAWTPTRPAPLAGFVPAAPETGLPRADVPPAEAPRVLPWTPTVRAPEVAEPADPELFLDAFAKAQAWNTLQRIESVREEARAEVERATDTPKPRAAEPDADYELL